MTLFLLGYAAGFKNKIKTIMRTLLAGVSIFILYTTAMGTTNAQMIYLTDSSVSPVVSYLNKFLNLQPKRSTSAAYKAGNKAFFEGFKDQIEELPEEEHLMTISSTLTKLANMNRAEVKEAYDLDKDIAIAILQGIYEMVEADKRASEDDIVTSTPSSSSSTKKENNSIYEIEVKEYQGETYYIYTLHEDINVKNANFHGEKGSFYHCMYQQCNKVAFLTKVTEVHLIFGNAEKAVIDMEESSSEKMSSLDLSGDEEDEDEEEENDYDHSNYEEEEDMDEEDLLEELSNLFGDIL